LTISSKELGPAGGTITFDFPQDEFPRLTILASMLQAISGEGYRCQAALTRLIQKRISQLHNPVAILPCALRLRCLIAYGFTYFISGITVLPHTSVSLHEKTETRIVEAVAAKVNCAVQTVSVKFLLLTPERHRVWRIRNPGAADFNCGVAGVLAFSVSGYTRKLEIRQALGAQRRSILSKLLSEGLVIAGIGVAAGFVLGFILERLIRKIVGSSNSQVYCHCLCRLRLFWRQLYLHQHSLLPAQGSWSRRSIAFRVTIAY
jgi:hypothetical protein